MKNIYINFFLKKHLGILVYLWTVILILAVLLLINPSWFDWIKYIGLGLMVLAFVHLVILDYII